MRIFLSGREDNPKGYSFTALEDINQFGIYSRNLTYSNVFFF